jgi:NAD+ synthase (glutamine-hydrolysing)
METFKKDGFLFALAQMPVQAGNPRVNADWRITETDRAEARGVDVIIFPELCDLGYLIGDKFEDDNFVLDSVKQNDRVIANTKGKHITVISGAVIVPDKNAKGQDGRMRKINGGFVAQNGNVLKNRAGVAFFAKTNIPKYRMFDEIRHMTSAQDLARELGMSIEDYLQPFDIPIGDQVLVVGVIDCEDSWIKDYFVQPPLILAEKGIDLLVNVSASPSGWQKNRARHAAFQTYLKDLGIPMIYVNISGTQNNGKSMYGFDGVSTVYNKDGDVSASLPPYFEGVQDVLVKPGMPAVSFAEPSDIVQLWDAFEYQVRGFFQTLPEHLRGAAVGLSGGVDSGVAFAALAYILGKDKVHGFNMPFRDYNGQQTRGAAAHIASALGTAYTEIPIDEPVEWSLRNCGNIQPGTDEFKTVLATQRGKTLMDQARNLGLIYTCNGNKSEIALNFFTNDGDGRGALALLGDLSKGEVSQLGWYINTVLYEREVIPWELITQELPPMDELGPSTIDVRKDPFDYGRVLRDGTLIRGYHDQLVHAFIGFRKDPEWLLQRYVAGDLESELLLEKGKIDSLFPTAEAFVADVERCWNALHASTWKRVQTPTNIPVSKRPFGFDYRESILPAYYTDRYFELKSELLAA